MCENTAATAYLYQTIILAAYFFQSIIKSYFNKDSNFTWTLTSLILFVFNSSANILNVWVYLSFGDLCYNIHSLILLPLKIIGSALNKVDNFFHSGVKYALIMSSTTLAGSGVLVLRFYTLKCLFVNAAYSAPKIDYKMGRD